jgi:hypothetical protein
MLLVHAGESRVQKMEETLYVSALVLPAVGPADSGLYVCLATNAAGGFNYKSAALTVSSSTLPAAANAASSSSSSALPPLVLYVVGGLSCVVLVLVTLLVSCLLRTRHRLQLSDCRSQTTLVYQTHSPASLYHKSAAGAQTAVVDSMCSAGGGGGGSVYKGNIYDIPYAHTKYTPVSLSDSASENQSPCSFRPSSDVGGVAGGMSSASVLLSDRPLRRVHELQLASGGGGGRAGSLESQRVTAGRLNSSRQSSCANSPRNPKRIVTINQRNIQYSTQYPDL